MSTVAELLRRHESEILQDWWSQLTASGLRRDLLMKEAELREQCAELIRVLRDAFAGASSPGEVQGEAWASVREMLTRISQSRGQQGFTSTETALFVFSLKQPLFARLRAALKDRPDRLEQEIVALGGVLDKLGLLTIEVHQSARERVIVRQQAEVLELSTPVVQLWDGVLALPLIGTLDSERTQKVMEALLHRIVETESEIAIIDITGVPTVDTVTAQHLLKTVTATRLMGADCIISGVRPQIAQTIVHLGVNLGDVTTKATLAAAFQLALQRRNLAVRPVAPKVS